jgi:type IV pilus assembly protein PilW
MKTPVNRCRPRDRGASAAAAGFTIVELMVALTVSLFIVGALLTVVLGSSAAGRTRERASELQINGRYAVEQIKTDLLHAGYLGISSLFFPDRPLSAENPAINIASACDAATAGQLSQRVWGTNDVNPYAATCIPAANYARGDVLVLRYLNPTPATAPFDQKLVYYHSAYEGGQPFKGPTAPDFSGSNKIPPYLDYRVEETVYYISPYTTVPTENPLVPALFRMKLGNVGSGPEMFPELVASGVENVQLRFGRFQTNDTVRYLTADEITNPADWDLVRSVQVWLLMRAATPEAGYVNNSTYAMGTQNVIVNDGFRRLLLSTVVQLRN